MHLVTRRDRERERERTLIKARLQTEARWLSGLLSGRALVNMEKNIRERERDKTTPMHHLLNHLSIDKKFHNRIFLITKQPL